MISRPIAHGTERGYQAHLRHGQIACDRCKEAHATKSRREYVGVPNKPPVPPHGTDRRYHKHIRDKDKPCARCKHAHNIAAQERRAVTPDPIRTTRKRTVRIPLDVFARLYWTADAEGLAALDIALGNERVDKLIKESTDGD